MVNKPSPADRGIEIGQNKVFQVAKNAKGARSGRPRTKSPRRTVQAEAGCLSLVPVPIGQATPVPPSPQ